ncbi:hypothetical protein P692DRAFT_201868462 [Suillus brevipes Sb2]|nr:hypothetical protein P692DRAFT_201868462 [Suillus brevipes Sb2]
MRIQGDPNDKTVGLWSTKTHKRIGQALRHTAKVNCVAISHNGELLVSGDDSGKVLLWALKDILEADEVDELITEDEETQRRRLLFHLGMQLPVPNQTQANNDEPTVNQDSSTNHPSETDGASGCAGDNQHSLLDKLTMIRNASNFGGLHAAEDLLTQEIDADSNHHHCYASRSVIRARKLDWDNALQDAVKSIAIQPSLLGYISKGIALCGYEQLWDAVEVFDLAFIFSNHDLITVNLILLIKAVALFNANYHDEAMRRVQDLAAASAYQHFDTLPYRIVNSYLRAQLAMTAFDDGRYSEAADRLSESIADLVSRGASFEPNLQIFLVLFGWDLDSLWKTANKKTM